MKKIFGLIFALLAPASLLAAPLEFDTPDAHVIVVRALDSWSGDNSASEDSLTAVKEHEGGFSLMYSKEKGVEGFPALFGSFGGPGSDKILLGKR